MFISTHDSKTCPICSESDGTAVAYVSSRTTDPTQQNLSFCPKYYRSRETLLKNELKGIQDGFSMPASTLESELEIYTVTHEYGHMVQNVVIKKAMEDYGLEELRKSINPNAKTGKTMYKQYHKISDETAKRCYNPIFDSLTPAKSHRIRLCGRFE